MNKNKSHISPRSSSLTLWGGGFPPTPQTPFYFICLSPSSSYYIYIYIYMCMCCEVIIWSKFGVFGSYYLVQVGFLEVIIWSKFVFLAYKNSGFKRFVLHTQLSLCVFLCPIIWQFSKNSLFQKKGAKIGVFNFQCFKFKFWKFSFLVC